MHANKGIDVRLEGTKVFVLGVSRLGFARLSGEEISKLDDKLRKEIDKCEKARGRTKTVLNIARDTAIAVSSLGHDFFVTCDRCLFESWIAIIQKHRMFKQQFKFPEVIYAKRSPEKVAKAILDILS